MVSKLAIYERRLHLYQDYLQFATEVAREAGKIMQGNFVFDMTREWKKDGTPLTVTDTTINQLVVERVNASFPGHAVLGEEQSHANDSRFLWVCDPVDGTIPFSHGLSISTFSLALVEDGVPVVGVVLDPFQKLFYSATLEQPTMVNGSRVQVNDSTSLAKQIVVLEGFAYVGKIWSQLKTLGAFPSTFLSFIFGAKQIASGQAGGAVFGYSFPWDAAALKILVEQAGGKTSDLDGHEQRYDRQTNGFVCSNGKIHDQLLEMIRSARAQT